MKNLFKLSLFTMGIVLSSGVMAATGTGHAQAELSNPLTVNANLPINLGTIAIDPAAGPQTVSIDPDNEVVSCPSSYVCSGFPEAGGMNISGAPGALINIDITGSTATLDDGSGNTLIFDPILEGSVKTIGNFALDSKGSGNFVIGGSVDFTGNETAGTYTSQNGSGYTVTVNY
ncbi:MAG: DUF4402 domain-containing protein [Alphaproteobacteria bacterium]|nr:DUF4402 domain-containing protein [Alphaproteobacteria bacterium]MBN2779684.1 DUF4402 domain-containing protein [Alphaproteobacteria bacterium]